MPCARKEAEMIGKLHSVTPLTEDRATKRASRSKSVSLIHFAVHGNAERGDCSLSKAPYWLLPVERRRLPPDDDGHFRNSATRNWMRSDGFDEISQWAPSNLIGDNAKIDFGNWPGSTTPEEQ